MKDTATRAREARLRKLRRDAAWLIGVLVVVLAASAAGVLVQHNDGWRVE